MRREIIEKIEIPEGIETEITGEIIKIKKNGKEMTRKYSGFEAKRENNFLILECKKATKTEKREIKTLAAHIRNILKGFHSKFEYNLQICAVHFPMSVNFDKAENKLIIKNFLGEVKQRTAKIVPGAEVKIEKEIITVSGENKEIAGQTAANIEKATRITGRDRRIFQDGIFIIKKPGDKD